MVGNAITRTRIALSDAVTCVAFPSRLIVGLGLQGCGPIISVSKSRPDQTWVESISFAVPSPVH